MATLKLTDDFFEDSYSLIAIHGSMENYSLAYFINQATKSKFKRAITDISLTENVTLPFYEWENTFQETNWKLFPNKIRVVAKNATQNLFGESVTYSNYFVVPQYKEVDFFLKMETDDKYLATEACAKILGIPKIITAYTLQSKQLKSTNNIIF